MRRLTRSIAAAILTLPLAFAFAQPANAARAGDPVAMTSGFYVDPDSPPAEWAAANPNDGRAAAINSSIASVPMARWFGSWSGSIGPATGSYVGRADHYDKLPVLVAYNMYGRDACGGHSSGGAASPAEYATWIGAFAGGIRNRPAVVILEPDSLGDYDCMTPGQIAERRGMLSNAIKQFRNQAPNTWVYLDAGNPGWLGAATVAERLHEAGLGQARGFSLNVSNFYTTSQNIAYAQEINRVLSSRYGYTKPFVVDTSRNGNGSNGEWCNPEGRKLGTRTQMGGGAEMLLWIKTPGQSDGDCGVGQGTRAGDFLPEVAYKMIYGY